MLVERTEIVVKNGSENDFAAAMATKGKPLLEGVDGVISVRFGPGIENPSKFILLIAWDSMAAHAAYNTMPVCTEIRQLIGASAAGAIMEHFEIG